MAEKASTELLDSLLHSNYKRVVLGALSGIAAGCVMLFLTTLFTPEGAGKLWWLQLMASACYSSASSIFDASNAVLLNGALWYFALSIGIGLLFAKMTTSTKASRLIIYGLVLGGFCWLASNMFAPDFFDVGALGSVKEWTRMFLFQSFTLSLALFVSLTTSFLSEA